MSKITYINEIPFEWRTELAPVRSPLPVGLKVVVTNDFGLSFPNRTITAVEQDEHGERYYYSPTDTPWTAVRRRNLTIQVG